MSLNFYGLSGKSVGERCYLISLKVAHGESRDGYCVRRVYLVTSRINGRKKTREKGRGRPGGGEQSRVEVHGRENFKPVLNVSNPVL